MAGEVAKAALTGAALGTAVGPVGTAVGAGIGALAGYFGSRKTKGEKALEASNAAEAARIADEQRRLGGGGGGMSASKLLGAQSAMRGAAASTANEQIANAMRGSAAGPSGMQESAIANAQESEQRALSQGMSAIRQQDLDYAEAQRQAIAAQKQQLFQNQVTTTEYQRQRKRELAAALGAAGQTAAGLQVPAVPTGAYPAYQNQAAQFGGF